MKRTIEIASNDEWIANHVLSVGSDPSGYANATADWHDSVYRRLNDLFGFGTGIAPTGQRILYHGWNGANTFARKESGLGTNCDFTDDEWAAAVAIADEEAARVAAEFEAAEIESDIAWLKESIEAEDDNSVADAWERLTDYHGLAADDERIKRFAPNVAELTD